MDTKTTVAESAKGAGSQIITFIQEHWRDGVEILILATLLYQLYRYFRATRGAAILTGLVALLVLLSFLSEILRLEVIGWLIKSFFLFLSLGLVVIFQPELRRALAELGSSSFFFFGKRKTAVARQLGEAVELLSNKRFGALFALETDEDLKRFTDTGVVLDANFSNELLMTIFHPKTALHDGGLIISNERLHAAGCVFPVSQRELLDRSIGLRHRAGLGLSEETDAIAIVVSEETGNISLCYRGKMEQDLTKDELIERLEEILQTDPVVESDGDKAASSKRGGSAAKKKNKKSSGKEAG